jgi:hypothetical protein
MQEFKVTLIVDGETQTLVSFGTSSRQASLSAIATARSLLSARDVSIKRCIQMKYKPIA